MRLGYNAFLGRRLEIEIREIIEQLESLVDTSSKVPATGRALVDMDRLTTILEGLRLSVPDEIQEAEEILKIRDSIINQANLEARRIRSAAEEDSKTLLASAEQESRKKVDESLIVREAEQKAFSIEEESQHNARQMTEDARRSTQQLLDKAESETSSQHTGADQYAREVLFNLEELMSDLLGQVRHGIDMLGVEEQTAAVE